MNVLETQAQFETMWAHTGGPMNSTPVGLREADKGWIVYFTASWCGPCKKLQCNELATVAAERGLTIFKCDDTVNDYTAGYCGVRAYPTFVFFQPKKIVGKIQSNDTETVKQWIRTL